MSSPGPSAWDDGSDDGVIAVGSGSEGGAGGVSAGDPAPASDLPPSPPARSRPRTAGRGTRRPPAAAAASYAPWAPLVTFPPAPVDVASPPPHAWAPPPAGRPPDPVVPEPAAFDAAPLGVAGLLSSVGRGLPAGYAPPFPERRRGGVLYAGPDEEVPAALPPARQLTFPLRAGCVALPARAPGARARAAAAARADAVLDWGVKLGKAEVAEGGSEGGSGAATSTPTPTAGFRRVDLSREQPPEVAKALVLRATASLGNKGTPVEAVVPLGRDTPQASAALALEALARLGFATLTARLVPLGATGGVAVVVDVALTEAAFAPPARAGKGAAAEAAAAGFGWDGESADPPPPHPSTGDSAALAAALHAMLTLGDGLRLGPDADAGLHLKALPRGGAGLDGRAPLAAHARAVPVLLAAAGLPPDAPAASPPPGLTTPLLPHQLAGLAWMRAREVRDARGHGRLALHPLWAQLVAADGQTFYAHRVKPARLSATLFTADWLAAGVRGGLQCDEMGTGKSLHLLALALAAPAPAGWSAADPDAGGGVGVGAAPVKTTLVVAPSNLVPQWLAECDRHVAPGALTVGVYGGVGESRRLGAGASGGGANARAARAPPAAPAPAAPASISAAVKREAKRGRRAPAPGPTLGLAVAAASAGRVAAGARAEAAPRAETAWAAARDGSRVPVHACDVVFLSFENLR